MRRLNSVKEEVRRILPHIRWKMDLRIGPILIFESNKMKVGLAFCHRRKDRSFKMSRHTLPLCARCTGLWLGFAMGLSLRFAGLQVPPLFAVAFMLPLMIDGLTQLVGYRESTNQLRLLTGVLFGIATNILFLGIKL